MAHVEQRPDEIRIRVWLVPLMASFFGGTLFAAVTWGNFDFRVKELEKLVYAAEQKNEPTRQRVAINTTIIENLGSDVKDIMTKQEEFYKKYDRNREEDQRFYRELQRSFIK